MADRKGTLITHDAPQVRKRLPEVTPEWLALADELIDECSATVEVHRAERRLEMAFLLNPTPPSRPM